MKFAIGDLSMTMTAHDPDVERDAEYRTPLPCGAFSRELNEQRRGSAWDFSYGARAVQKR